ncbi:hypothetical protein Taro_001163 [Colocasia esculenta]|uniref:Uncharacterized protein n=1 Tax=Colocasia esculenta TaxID=4460 RepID=A0A843TFE4_COLES|nr:hypothetical protein [Colocasia esculenta]
MVRRSFSRGCSLCVPRCCFRIVFDSAGSTGVMSGPTLVVGRGITLFCCFVVLCSSFPPLSSEFLLLWMVRD